MAKFITQELFNMCAVAIAKLSHESGQSVENVATIIASDYSNTYKDTELSQKLELAADEIIEYLLTISTPEKFPAYYTQLLFCIKLYNPDGSKKKRKILGGTLFNKEKKEIINKIQICTVSVTKYLQLVHNGSIPIAPQGWKF